MKWPGIKFGPLGREVGLSHATAQGRKINPNYYLQIQFVPRSKHTLSRLQEPSSYCSIGSSEG